MEKKPRVLIAESREALRKGLCAIFAQEPGGALTTEVATSEDLKEQLEHQAFDLVVVHQSLVTDLTILPRGNFILLTTETDIDMLFAARLHGARAYLLENASAALLRQTLHLTRGTFLTDPAVSASIAEYLSHHLLLSISDEALTARERTIFPLLWSGLSNREMARQLGLSEATVKTHVKHIYEKLRLNRRQVKIIALLRKGGWQA
jgi:DNA-binding NarL/FixJ family response regulator